MSFPQFPNLIGIEYPVGRSPMVDSNRVRAKSGRTTNLANWPDVLYQHQLSISYLSAAARKDWQNLEGFWKNVMTSPGQYFQFSNPEDSVAALQSFGVGNSVTTQFYLTRRSGNFTENVHAPRVNLVHEDMFNHSQWTSTGLTPTLANIADPNAGTIGYRVFETTLNGVHNLADSVSLIANADYTVSCYAKAGTRSWVMLRFIPMDSSQIVEVWFNVSTGAIGTNVDTTGTLKNIFITAVAGGWYRIGFTANSGVGSGASSQVLVYLATGDNVSTYVGDITKSLDLFGACCEIGYQHAGFTSDHTPASAFPLGPLVYYSPWQVSPANQNYTNSRSNLVLRSEDFSNASWTKTNLVANSSTINWPNALQAGSTAKNGRLTENAVNSTHSVSQAVGSLTTGMPYTFSVFIAPSTRTWAYVDLTNADGSVRVYVNLSTGAIGTTTGAPLKATVTKFTETVGGGVWYQVAVTLTAGSGTSITCLVGSATADNTPSYTGTSVDAIFVYAAQLEVGSRASNYILTTTVAVAYTDYALDNAGLVTFTTAPTATGSPSWAGYYDWLCQFDDDSADFQNFLFNYWSLGKIKFTSARVP